MSLVNDALRRAKDADGKAPPPPPSQMQFRPMEPGQHARQNLGLLVLATLGLVALLALFLVWQWVQGRKGPQLSQARALTPAAASANAVRRHNPPSTAAVPARAPASVPTPVAAPPTVAAAAPAQASVAAIAADQTNQLTNAAASAAALVPKPAPLRLQAIVYHPQHPSALISGKTVFIGEKVGDARVVAIDQESATLVSAGKTNVLSLAE